MAESKAMVLVKKMGTAFSALDAPPETLTIEECLTVYAVLDVIEKQLVGVRKSELREYLMAAARKTGVANANGSCKVTLEDGAFEARASKGKITIDHDALKALLKEKEIPLEQVYPSVPTFDPARLDALVVLGTISAADLRSVTAVGERSYALYVTKPSAVQALLPAGGTGKKG